MIRTDKILCCSRCGCEDILQPYLVEASSKKIIKYMDWLDDYCPVCNASTRSITIKEFYKNKNTVKCMECKWVGNHALLRKAVYLEEVNDICPICSSINIMNL